MAFFFLSSSFRFAGKRAVRQGGVQGEGAGRFMQASTEQVQEGGQGGPGGGQGYRGWGGPRQRAKSPKEVPPRNGLEPPRSLKSARWRLPGPPGGALLRGAQMQVKAYRRHDCEEAGKRIGSLCAIEVEGIKRRPPTEVGGLSLEFRV